MLLSTGHPFDRSGMTHTPYDDPASFKRRWSHLTDEQRHIEADLDPLLFLADHVVLSDRGEGALVIHIDTGPYGAPLAMTIPDGPLSPSDAECVLLLHRIVDSVSAALADQDDNLGGICPVWAIGLIHHRRGKPHVNDLDRRWARAVQEAADWCGARSLGIIARTHDGAIVRVPPMDDEADWRSLSA